MPDKYIPAVGSSGFYDLLPPFANQVSAKERYTLQAVRRISDYVASNEDVKTTVYLANAIPSEVFDEDVVEDNEVLSIQSARGHWLHVPVRYVKCYPEVNGIPYRAVSLVAPLQPIPVDTDLTDLLSKVNELVMAKLGFTSSVQVVETTRVVLVSHNQHRNTQLDRALQKDVFTEAVQIGILNGQIDVLRARVQSLENLVLQLTA